MLKHKRFLVPVAVLLFSLVNPAVVFAATPTLSRAGVRLGRLGSAAGGAGSGNDILVTFQLRTNSTTVTNMVLTFPTGFTVTAGSPTVSVGTYPNTPAGITSPGALTASATSSGAGAGGTITVSGLSSPNNTSLYGFVIPEGTVTNPTVATGTQYSLTLASRAGSTVQDSSLVATYITTASADQVTVSASVAPNFSFSLTGTADTIPAIDKTTIQTSTGVTMKVSTNAPLGYTAYVKSAQGGLRSSTANYTIPTGTFNTTPDTLTAGTSEYAFVPTASTICVGGCGTAPPVFDGEYAGLTANSVTSPSTGGSFNSTNFSSFVSRAGYTGEDDFLLQERAAVGAAVPYANDYTDTLTIVAAGNF